MLATSWQLKRGQAPLNYRRCWARHSHAGAHDRPSPCPPGRRSPGCTARTPMPIGTVLLGLGRVDALETIGKVQMTSTLVCLRDELDGCEGAERYACDFSLGRTIWRITSLRRD